MSGEVHHPHDKFFKTWFSRPENLIPFLETALPTDVFKHLDVSTLDISDGTFIDEEHREHFSDLSASVQIKGRKARLYILVEHKSYADKWALLQILRYMVQTWTRDARTEAAVPLVPIIPILFYHGETKSIVTDFSSLFGAGYPETLGAYRPDFQCEIFNLTTRPDSELEELPQLSAALWVMKYARTQTDLALRALSRLAGTMDRMARNDPAFKEIELYLLASSSLTPEDLINTINQLLTDNWLKEDIMSTAEMLIAQGISQGISLGKAEGLSQGISQGISQGKAEGLSQGLSQGISQGKAEGGQAEKLAIAKRLKKFGMPLAQLCQATGISEAEADAL